MTIIEGKNLAGFLRPETVFNNEEFRMALDKGFFKRLEG